MSGFGVQCQHLGAKVDFLIAIMVRCGNLSEVSPSTSRMQAQIPDRIWTGCTFCGARLIAVGVPFANKALEGCCTNLTRTRMLFAT